MRTAADVLAGRGAWACEVADCLAWLAALPDDSVDLLLFSPPYEFARTYGMGERMVGGQEWVDWMVAVVRAAAPKVKGLTAINCDGQTRGYAYSGTPYLLFADLHRAGFNLRRPVVYHRVGIPGSGGPDWLRGDTEPVLCVTRPGRLPWSDPTACGHPPKWAPGGEMSHRMTDGSRRNQWGKNEKSGGERRADGTRACRPQPGQTSVAEEHQVDDTPGLFDNGESPPTRVRSVWGGSGRRSIRRPDGTLVKQNSASEMGGQGPVTRRHTKRVPAGDGDEMQDQTYTPPVLANPGTVVNERYTADEVMSLLEQAGDLTHHLVGGGQMGSPLAHENEAPFPLTLAEFFVRSFCPPGGVVADCFAGSGTVAHAALEHGRRFVGCDVRQSQVDLVARRVGLVTPGMFDRFADEEPA